MHDTTSRKFKSTSILRVLRDIFQSYIPQYSSSKRKSLRASIMASPQSAYVTAVPDDYDIEQPSSPTDSEASASVTSNMHFDSFTWSDLNHISPYTISTLPPQSTTSSRKSSYDSASLPRNSHSHSASMSQKWHLIITSNSCPQSLSGNP
jgi:hypothetical protein